jgi:hypothetical protein
MTGRSRADRISEVLQALAYHDFSFSNRTVDIFDDDSPLADEQRIHAAAEEQVEKHLLLHHGLPCDGRGEVRDDWCIECTKQFLSDWFDGYADGSFSSVILEAGREMEIVEDFTTKEFVTDITLRLLRVADQNRAKNLQEGRSALRDAVRAREGFGPERGAISGDDSVTGFYADWLGKRFPAMIDRAGRLNAIPARAPVPESVQRYLAEASKCYIFGQYLASLVVCRAAIEFALGDFLERNGLQAELKKLQQEKRDGLLARIDIAEKLNTWKLNGKLDVTLTHAEQIRNRAGKALHRRDNDLRSDECKDLFLKARGVLRDLYS